MDFTEKKFIIGEKANNSSLDLVCETTKSKPTTVRENEQDPVNPFGSALVHSSCQMSIDPPLCYTFHETHD